MADNRKVVKIKKKITLGKYMWQMRSLLLLQDLQQQK